MHLPVILILMPTMGTQDGRAVIVVPLHRSLCSFHYVHLFMFSHFCKMVQWAFTITNLSCYKNPAGMRNWLARWTRDGWAVILVPLNRSLGLISECHFGDGTSLFKHCKWTRVTSKSPSISQLDIILTPNWYKLTPNTLFPTRLLANYHIIHSWPKIHSKCRVCGFEPHQEQLLFLNPLPVYFLSRKRGFIQSISYVKGTFWHFVNG